MKDYKFIKFVSKKFGFVPSRKGNTLLCGFPYGGTHIHCIAIFENGTAVKALFNLVLINEFYHDERNYDSLLLKLVITAISKGVNNYSVYEGGESTMLSCDLQSERVEHAVSQLLTQVSFLQKLLDEVLGLQSEDYEEEDWRNFHRLFLNHQKNKHTAIAAVGFIITCGCIAVFIALMAGLTNSGVLGALAILISIPSFIVGVVGLCKRAFYKHSLKRSLEERRR